MVTIIGLYQHISEAIADLIPDRIKVRHISIKLGENSAEIENKAEIENNKCISTTQIFILNIDGLHKEAFTLIALLKKIAPASKILALDTHNSTAMAQHIIDNGATAYLPITVNAEQLSKIILENLSDRNNARI